MVPIRSFSLAVRFVLDFLAESFQKSEQDFHQRKSERRRIRPAIVLGEPSKFSFDDEHSAGHSISLPSGLARSAMKEILHPPD